MPDAPRPGLEHLLSEACVAFASCRLPDAVLRAAERVILDWLGCALAGAEARPALIVAAAHSDELGAGPATCLTGPTICAPGLAALISGVASHTAELDDIFSPALYHPAVCVVSAALSACQSARAGGEVFLRAVIAGYEISNRIGAAVNPIHYEYWHTTGTVGTLGAALASSLALGLTAQQTGWGLGHAASMAAGLQQAFRGDGMTKPLHAGRAAEGGLQAARLARLGFVGTEGMLSGPVGFIRAMSHGRDIDLAFDDLFGSWTIERTTFKRFSACGHVFAAIDAALELATSQPVAAEDLRAVQIATYAKAIDVAGIRHPESAFEAKFSIPFCVAAALLGHDLTDTGKFDELYRDAAIHRLIDRVEVGADPEISKAFPALRGARVALYFVDGHERCAFVRTRKGEPGNPLTEAELEGKFRKLVGETRHAGREADLIGWVRTLTRHESLAPASLPLADGASTGPCAANAPR